MQLQEITRFGIPERLVAVWKEQQGDRLLPVQRLVIRKGLLGRNAREQGRSFVICAPTSSGKSFCAELAAAAALARRQKVIVLFPLKALAEEKYRRLNAGFGRLGLSCLIATADHPENDALLLAGRFDLAVAIYEKLDLLLAARLDLLTNVGLVVIDELQMIAEPGRGAILERLLTRLRASHFSPQLLGLSAVVGDESGRQLADWLGGELIEESTRPVELIRGVAANGSLRYRSFNSGCDGTEPFTVAAQDDRDLADLLIRRLKQDDGATLVFLKSRRDTVHCAVRLAAKMNHPPATTCLEQLKEEEPSFLVRSLRQVLSRGIAFHNADLSMRQRNIIEQGFVNKEINTIISTTTLGMGINLPADTVYLETVKYQAGDYDNRPSLVPISRAEFDNMTGRAGRLGVGDDRPGRAIVLADSDFDRDILWENYISPGVGQAVVSTFDRAVLEDWLLHGIVCGLIGSDEAIPSFFRHSFWGQNHAPTALPITGARDRLLISEMVRYDEAIVSLSATPLGRAVALSGLTVRAARYYTSQMALRLPETPFGWLALALSGPDWTLPAGMLSRFEQRENLPVRMLYQRFDYAVEEAAFLLPADHRKVPLSYRQAATVKALLLLTDWCRLVPVQRLEEQYQLHLGQIMSLGDTAGHLVTAIASLVEARDRQSPVIEALHDQAFSLRHGIPAEYREIRQKFGDLLSRMDMSRLQEAGVNCLGELMELAEQELSRLFSVESKLLLIKEKLQSLKEEDDMAMTIGQQPSVSGEPQLLEIDGSPCGERFLVRLNGFNVPLTGKSFKYLVKLAWFRLRGDSGWIYKEDIEVGFNQARYLYRMKNEISSGVQTSWPLVENNRLGYYRLALPPERIRINLDNLREHPDWEVRRMALGESGGAVH